MGYSGVDCAEGGCPNGCSGQGACVGGKCLCAAGWEASDCSVRLCPHRCSGRGVCLQESGECVCAHGYGGPDCAMPSLPPSTVPAHLLAQPFIDAAASGVAPISAM